MSVTKPLNATIAEWLDDDDLIRERISVYVWCEDCGLYAEVIRSKRTLNCPLCGERIRAKAEPELYEDAN